MTLLAALAACDAPAGECAEADADERNQAVAAPAAEAALEAPAAPAAPEAPEAPAAEVESPEPRVPTVTQAAFQGELDPDLIRRIVRAHINEIRHCYNEGLASDPELAGRVVIAFTIAESGDVEDAAIAETSLADASVAACMRGAVTRWIFPRPNGGSVQVTYPFVLEPG